MAKTHDLSVQLAKVQARSREQGQRPGARAATPRQAPVKMTATLEPQPYRRLVSYAISLAGELGVTRVTHADLFRALVAELDDNPELQDRIKARIARQMAE